MPERNPLEVAAEIYEKHAESNKPKDIRMMTIYGKVTGMTECGSCVFVTIESIDGDGLEIRFRFDKGDVRIAEFKFGEAVTIASANR